MFKKKLPVLADEIYDVLSVLKIAKRIQVHIYIKKTHPEMTDESIGKLIENMIADALLFVPMEGYLSVVPYFKKNEINIGAAVQFFWFYIALLDDEGLYFDLGRYPSDYIVAKGEILYEVIIYSDNGSFKLNYLNHKRENPHDTVVMIILLNAEENDVPVACRPKEKYQFLSIISDNQIDSIPKITVSGVYDGEK